MRNLKRTLSLLLAVVMVIGMMVVGASAVSYNDFSDSGEIVNKDAVSMLTTLGVINGKEDGSYFDPTGDVTRAEMAKMISVMLSNNENCDDLYMTVNSGLTDIANSWARGYINYCYTLDIIAGRGDNTFDPTANVTGVEAAKMLLSALGYDPAIEGLVGADWDLNTASLAHRLGIFRNFTKDVNAPLNRDDAALLIYNAMDVEMIQQYSNGYAIAYSDHRTVLSSVFGVIRVEGVVVANEWAQLQETDSDAALREGRTTLDNVVWYDSTTSNTVVAEGVRETDPVTFNVTTPVEYMGQAVTMYVEKTTILSNSKVIGVATNDEMNVIVSTADGADKANDVLDGTGVSVDRNTQYYVNYGYCGDQAEAIDIINDCGYCASGDDFDVKGVEVQVIDNDDDGIAEYVLYTQETLSKVYRYNNSDEILTFYKPVLDSNGIINTTTPERVNVDFEDVVFNDEVATDDLILYVEYGGRTYVSLPEIVTDTMARVDRDEDRELYITLDNGDEYYESHIRDVASRVDADVENFDDDDARETPGFDDLYDFILDSNGYVVAVRPAEEVVTNFALVLDSAWTQNALTRGGEVEILMADGTTGTYTINWNESRKALSGIDMGDVDEDSNTNSDLNEKLEIYLGTRDVNAPDGDTYYETGMAAGSLITYTLNDNNVLTIERIYQGNQFANNSDLEIKDTDTKTAGVGDNGEIVYMSRSPMVNQYQVPDGVETQSYTSGRGYIEVYGVNETWSGRDTANGVGASNIDRREQEKTYAVDRNTIAFYYDGKDYAVATGWQNMGDITGSVEIQVYPVVEKTNDGSYQASNLAEVIIFSKVPDIDSNDYMLVLNRNAYVGGDLYLNVVFEDGTVAEVEIDDQGGYDFSEDEDDDVYKAAYAYVENSDGTYDIVEGSQKTSVYADLLRVGTVAYAGSEAAVDSNTAKYIAYDEDKANVWDVTGVDSARDNVVAGDFNTTVVVNAVIIADDDQIRTAWIWDIPVSTTPDGDDDDHAVLNSGATGANWITDVSFNGISVGTPKYVYNDQVAAVNNAIEIDLDDFVNDVTGNAVVNVSGNAGFHYIARAYTSATRAASANVGDVTTAMGTDYPGTMTLRDGNVVLIHFGVQGNANGWLAYEIVG